MSRQEVFSFQQFSDSVNPKLEYFSHSGKSTSMDAEIEKLLPLERQIARSYANIPGLRLSEIEIQAQDSIRWAC